MNIAKEDTSIIWQRGLMVYFWIYMLYRRYVLAVHKTNKLEMSGRQSANQCQYVQKKLGLNKCDNTVTLS